MAYQLSNSHARLQRTSVFDRPSMSDEPDDEQELRCAPAEQSCSLEPVYATLQHLGSA